MLKRIAILQSNYIPWKGYFDIINSVDVFVLYDDMQYTRRDWRNRNLIKTPQGTQWLTIPVCVKGNYYQRICDTMIADRSWAEKHRNALRHNYARAQCFQEVFPFIEAIYEQCRESTCLSQVNFAMTRAVCSWLDIRTEFVWSQDLCCSGDKTERLIDICSQLGGDVYLSGPAARSYLDEKAFSERGIRVEWMDYNGYPEYEQLYTPPFCHTVSILDLLLNKGKDARNYMLSFA